MFLFFIKLVTFPEPTCDEPPAWLSWTHDEWERHRATWYDAVDEVYLFVSLLGLILIHKFPGAIIAIPHRRY